MLIDNTDPMNDLLRQFYRVDKCNNIDCEYLNNYHMKKSEKHMRSYEKFCRHLPFLFKGIVWLNMYQAFGKMRPFNPFKIPVNKEELVLNIDIRKSAVGPLKDSLIFIPTKTIYNVWDNYTNEEKQYYFDDTGTQKEYWVYGRLNDKKKTIQKIDIKKLPNKYFIAPLLYIDGNDDFSKYFVNFVKNGNPRPKLTKIKKTSKNLGGELKKDLQEQIDNSMTIHWVVVHKNKLRDYIDYLLSEYLD